MKQITLTNGMKTMVDDGDFNTLNAFTWTYHESNKNKQGYVVRREGSSRKRTIKRIFMARQIMNPPNGFEVDHRDRNKLNNQRYNLRICTPAQNKMNTRKPSNETGYIGVRKNWDRFSAQIQLNGKVTYLGTFNTAREAAKAYDIAAKAKGGEFAVLNFS